MAWWYLSEKSLWQTESPHVTSEVTLLSISFDHDSVSDKTGPTTTIPVHTHTPQHPRPKKPNEALNAESTQPFRSPLPGNAQ